VPHSSFAPASAGRYHALDALRGAAMFLGILLHAAIPYTKFPLPFWPVQDGERSSIFDVFLLVVHDFRMQTFFLLAGFFGCLLYTRYGWQKTAMHRLKRIALPLALAMLIIQPLVQSISVFAAAQQTGSTTAFYGEPVPAGDTPMAAAIHHLATGGFLQLLVHLWFLWFLLLCFAVMLPIACLADRLRDRPLGNRWDLAVRWLLQSRFRWVLLALLTMPFLLPMQNPAGPDTCLGWLPPPHLVAYYFVFFLTGWTLYRHRDLLGEFVGSWKKNFVIGNLLILPLGAGFLYVVMKPEMFGLESGAAFITPAKAALAVYTWFMIGGLTGLFLSYLSKQNAVVRWLADSSYWCYLASLPPVVLLQYLALTWPIAAPLKFAVVSVGTIGVLLVSYQWGVRYTWIGVLLNGARVKPVAVKVAEPVAVEVEVEEPVPVLRAA
jgi:hypothetical protein